MPSKTLCPPLPKELEFFAAHNSDLGANGHRYRRDESVALQPVAQSFTDSYIKGEKYNENDYAALQETFGRMAESGDILLTDAENTPLVKEMKPWLTQFKLLGENRRRSPGHGKSIRKRQSGTVYAQIQTCKSVTATDVPNRPNLQSESIPAGRKNCHKSD